MTGVYVARTKVSDVLGREGFYHYRGYNAVDLARRGRVEDSWHLLLAAAVKMSSHAPGRYEDEVICAAGQASQPASADSVNTFSGWVWGAPAARRACRATWVAASGHAHGSDRDASPASCALACG